MVRLSKLLPDWLKLTALAFLVRWFWLTREQLWFDEAFTAWVIRPTTNFWQAILGDVHPPLWNLIEAVMVRLFGESAFTMRFPALLFSVLAVLLVWAIARQTFLHRGMAFTAGLIAALLPAAVYFGQDARMYSAFACFVLVMVYGAIKHNGLIYILGGLAAIYTHNAGVCFVLAVGLAYTLMKGPRALIPSLVIMLGWLPWAGVVLSQMGRVQAGYWPAPLNLGGALYPVLLTTVGWRMVESVQVPVSIIIILLSSVTLWTIRCWTLLPLTWPLLAAIMGGPLVLLAFSILIENVWVYRALLPAGILLCIPWAYTLYKVTGESRQILRLLFSFALGIALLSHYFPNQSRPDVLGWLAPIREGWQEGDLIYYLNAADAVAYVPYAPYPYAIRPTPASLLTISADCRAAFGLVEQPLATVTARRIWVAFHRMPYTPQSEVDYFESLMRYPHSEVEAAKDSVLYRFDLYGSGN